MARYECERCGVACFTTDPPHLCSDLRKRLERQEKAIAIVDGLIQAAMPGAMYNEDRQNLSAAIVRALSGRELGT